ncbi:hypothetical protein FRC09_006184 [Ceratobasidium sp. 395]|nr:hypothetical protein FRC09_006184 [Ceratobasidium sp. 395]
MLDMNIRYLSVANAKASSQSEPIIVVRRNLQVLHTEIWINQCVGLRNERHFISFMSYFVVATFCFVYLGYTEVWKALDFGHTRWSHRTPEMAYIIIYILALALGLAVCVMLLWNVYQIGQGITTVEGYDYGLYAERAKDRGETFVNSYNLGFFQNLAYFFNVIPSGYPLWVLLLPLRTAPYTNGFVWARKTGYSRHAGLREGDEMTDDED